jgi:hypothetical protein
LSVFCAKNFSFSLLRPFAANTKQKTADLTDAAEKKKSWKRETIERNKRTTSLLEFT